MEHRFAVAQWAAFAPGLEDESSWRDWAGQPVLPCGDSVPALSEMPALQRRRLERLGRMALQVAYRCQVDADVATPLVFASRHGDIARTHEMLQELARDQPLSPTQFGLSTHNAIAAQYSIARGLTANCSVLAAGAHSAEAAVTEAVALLADGEREVLVVVYDVPPPEVYAAYTDEPQAPYAWAWRIAHAPHDECGYTLESVPASAPQAPPGELPHGLDVLRFFLAGERELLATDAMRAWRWRRYG